MFGVVYSLYLVIYVHEGFATSKLALGCRVPLVDISLFLFKSMTTIWDLYYFGICILNMGNIFASLSLVLNFWIIFECPFDRLVLKNCCI